MINMIYFLKFYSSKEDRILCGLWIAYLPHIGPFLALSLRPLPALVHSKKPQNHITNTYGNHKLLKQSEALIAAKTGSNTVEGKTLSSSLNVHAKPFEPDHALHVAEVVRVKGELNEIAGCLSRPPDINAVF